jgi:hypothetical protein
LVSIVEPGPRFGVRAVDQAPRRRRQLVVERRGDRARFRAFQDVTDADAQSNAEVADVIVAVAASEQPVLRYQTSEMVQRLIGRKLKDMDGQRVTDLTSGWI